MPWPEPPKPKSKWDMLLGKLQLPTPDPGGQFSVPGQPGWDPNTLANRYDEPSVMEPKWMSVARKFGQGLGQVGEMAKGLVTGGGEEPGQTAENFGGILGAALPFAGPAGFYSRVNRVAEGIPAKIHPNKLMALLKSGASQEEVAYRELPEFISGHGNNMISRDDLWKFLSEHQAPEVGVVRKGEIPILTPADPDYGSPWTPHETNTKYQDYQVPGGENYRETLMQLKPKPTPPPKVLDATKDMMASDKFGKIWDDLTPQQQAQLAPNLQTQLRYASEANNAEAGNYLGPHWDEPNVLVHGRSQDYQLPGTKRIAPKLEFQNSNREWVFSDPNDANPDATWYSGFGNTEEEAYADVAKQFDRWGKRPKNDGPSGHLVENVQSDWHQTGRKEGYRASRPTAEEIQTARENYLAVPIPLDGSGDAEAGRLYNIYKDLEASAARNETLVPDAPFKDTWPDLQLKQQILDAANNPKAEWIGVTEAKELRRRGETISPEFQDQRLPDTLKKLLAPFGGSGSVEHLPLRNDITEPAKAWIARLTPEMKAQIKAKGFPLMTIAILATQGQRAQGER